MWSGLLAASSVGKVKGNTGRGNTWERISIPLHFSVSTVLRLCSMCCLGWDLIEGKLKRYPPKSRSQFNNWTPMKGFIVSGLVWDIGAPNVIFGRTFRIQQEDFFYFYRDSGKLYLGHGSKLVTPLISSHWDALDPPADLIYPVIDRFQCTAARCECVFVCVWSRCGAHAVGA